jgi:hypothetical protein
MKNIYILALCLFSFLLLAGCRQKKEVELTQKDFSELDVAKVTEIEAANENIFDTGDRWLKIGIIFPIKDPNKISTIINCIKKADFDPNARKILSLDLLVASLDRRESSNYIKRKEIFREIYSFSDPNIIMIINKYIIENNSIPLVTVDDVIPFHKLYFKTNKDTYYIRFLWDKKTVYGDWWDSPELLKYFREWGFKP